MKVANDKVHTKSINQGKNEDKKRNVIEGTIEREDTQLKNLKKASTQTVQQTQDQVEKRYASTAIDQRTIKDVTNKRSGRVKHRDDTDKMMNYDRRQ